MINKAFQNKVGRSRIVGILGGMGPYATLMFMKNIMDLTPAKKDWDHIRLVVDSNPHIPSRTRAVLYNEMSPVEGMVESCLKLQKYPVDVILVPCNSAAYWIDQVQKHIRTPILNIIEITSAALLKDKKNLKVVVLGGMVTYLKNTYKKYIEKSGSIYIKPTKKIQDEVAALIENVKLGCGKRDLREQYLSIIRELVKKQKVSGIILACTELTMFKNVRVPVVVVDSSFELAKFIVNYTKETV